MPLLKPPHGTVHVTSEASPSLEPDQRYSRQILFPGIGPLGQALLAKAHVAIVGVGATGAAASSLLARAGVGNLTLIDRDVVEPSNLQRQVLFDEADALASNPKADAARRKIQLFNSSIQVFAHTVDLVPGNIHQLLAPANLILDATDNFETRYLLNDFAVQTTVPWIYAAAIGAYATTMIILPRPPVSETADPVPPPWQPTACLACIFPQPPSGPIETCDTAGILSTAVNLAASIQVTEALKILTGQPHLVRRTLLSLRSLESHPIHGPRARRDRHLHPQPRLHRLRSTSLHPSHRPRADPTSPSAAATRSRFTSTSALSTSPP